MAKPPSATLDDVPLTPALMREEAKAYRESVSWPDTDEMFTETGKNLAYQWQDKKHRHVYDLCTRLEAAADKIEELEHLLASDPLQ